MRIIIVYWKQQRTIKILIISKDKQEVLCLINAHDEEWNKNIKSINISVAVTFFTLSCVFCSKPLD